MLMRTKPSSELHSDRHKECALGDKRVWQVEFVVTKELLLLGNCLHRANLLLCVLMFYIYTSVRFHFLQSETDFVR